MALDEEINAFYLANGRNSQAFSYFIPVIPNIYATFNGVVTYLVQYPQRGWILSHFFLRILQLTQTVRSGVSADNILSILNQF